LYAGAVYLICCIRAVVFAEAETAVFSVVDIRRVTSTLAVLTNTMLAAVVRLLVVERVDVHKDK
jgi:hypothetical protein